MFNQYVLCKVDYDTKNAFARQAECMFGTLHWQRRDASIQLGRATGLSLIRKEEGQGEKKTREP